MNTHEIKAINKFNKQVAKELTERFGFPVIYEYTRNKTARFIFDNNKFSIGIGNKLFIPFRRVPKIYCYIEMIHCFQLDDKWEYPYIDRKFKRDCISKMPLETKYLPQ